MSRSTSSLALLLVLGCQAKADLLLEVRRQTTETTISIQPCTTDNSCSMDFWPVFDGNSSDKHQQVGVYLDNNDFDIVRLRFFQTGGVMQRCDQLDVPVAGDDHFDVIIVTDQAPDATDCQTCAVPITCEGTF